MQSSMLSTFSWPQYIAAVAVTGTCYYSYVLLRYYQREISALFTGKATATAITKTSSIAPMSVMGGIQEGQHVSILDEQEFQFTGDDQTETEHTDIDQLNQIPANPATGSLQHQLIKEINELMNAYTNVGNKIEFLSLLAILFDAYQQYSSEIDLSIITASLLSAAPGKLPFPISANDIPVFKN